MSFGSNIGDLLLRHHQTPSWLPWPIYEHMEAVSTIVELLERMVWIADAWCCLFGLPTRQSDSSACTVIIVDFNP